MRRRRFAELDAVDQQGRCLVALEPEVLKVQIAVTVHGTKPSRRRRCSKRSAVVALEAVHVRFRASASGFPWVDESPRARNGPGWRKFSDHRLE